MNPALAFHSIASCVALLYSLNNIEQKKANESFRSTINIVLKST